MYIRYFATNRDRENLGRDLNRDQRISLQEGGYHWIDTEQYMSYYLATTDTKRMPSSSLILESQATIFEDFLSKKSIKNILVFVHGFNVELHQALTSFSVLTDALDEVSELQAKIIVDPCDPEVQKKLKDDNLNLTAAVGFSWPSDGKASPLSYNSDRKDAAFSAATLANLISMIRLNHIDAKIHVIAHSMGNFLVCKMLEMLVSKQIFPLAQFLVKDEDLENKEILKKQLERRDRGGDSAFFIDRFIMLAPDVERRHVTQCDQHDQENPKAYYLGPFYAGLYHLVEQSHLFYSRYDQALKLSKVEKEALREKPDQLWRKLTFQGVNPDNLWEDSLGLNPAPELSPPNLSSHNASTLSNRAIDHGDYFDTPNIVKKIAELILK